MKKPPRKYTLADVLWEHDVWRSYYDGMEAVSEKRLDDAEVCFQQAHRLNPDFPGSYEGFAAIAATKHDKEAEKKFIALAFQKVLVEYPRWPRRLAWGILENRSTLRIILIQAMLYHKNGNRAEAETLYRLLLKLNPSDNQGARYLLAGLKDGLQPDEIDDNR